MELIIFQIIVLIFSVIIHEVSHGLVADYLGDNTARLAGRLTLNPLRHLDPFGSVIFPLLLSLIPGGVIFGWAKPVPYDPRNLKNPDKGGALIAVSGPISNLLIAFVFGLTLSFLKIFGFFGLSSFPDLISQIILINVFLAVFNLVPIPPLDGSKVLFLFMGKSSEKLKNFLEEYGFFMVVIFIFFGFFLINPIISWLYNLFMGF